MARSRLLPLLAGLLVAAAVQGVAAAADGLAAADVGEPWRWRKYDRGGRLPAGRVSALGHDRDDMIYAGTDEGLFRYNGYQWTRLASLEPVGDTALTRIVESEGEIYVATSTDVWILRLGVELQRLHGSDGLLLAESAKGVYAIDLAEPRHLRIGKDGASPVDGGARPVALPRGELHDYVVDEEDVHWLATSEGLYRREVGRKGPWRRDASVGNDLAGLPCRRLFLVKYQPIVRSTVSYQVDVFRPRFQVWAMFEGDDRAPVLARRQDSGEWAVVDTVRSPPVADRIVVDGRGNHYLTTESGELLFSPDGKAWEAVPEPGIGKSKLRAGILDLHGYVWFAYEYSEGRGGVARFDPESRRWERIRETRGPPAGERIEKQMVHSLLESSDGTVWIGTERGLFQYEGGAVYRHYAIGKGESRRVTGSPNGEKRANEETQRVTGLAEDEKERVWFTSPDFAGAYYREGGRWFEYGALSAQPIRRIVTDRRGGLWFLPAESVRGGQSLGRFRFNFGVPQFDSFPMTRGPVNDLVEAADGAFWAATDQGLVQLTLRQVEPRKSALTVERVFDDQSGLRSSRVWALTENSADGSIWICYRDAGVSRIRGDVIDHYDERNGLRSPVVWSMMTTSTAMGWNLWLGTDRGISRFDRECWYHYPVAGLEPQSSQVLSLVPSRQLDEILVGTSGNGVFRFRKDDFRRPKFVMTDFARPTGRGDALLFTWDARDMKDGTPPEELLYRYRLDGGPWSLASNAKRTELVGLSPGPHTFEVQVRDLDGNWNRPPEYHRFEVVARSGLSGWVLATVVGVGVPLAVLALLTLARIARRLASPVLKFRGAFRGLETPVLVVDDRGRIVDYNGVRPELVGVDTVSPRRLLGMPLLLLPALRDEDVRTAVSDALAGRASRSSRRPEGEDRVMTFEAIPLRARAEGPVVGAVVLVADETAVERLRTAEARRVRMSAVCEVARNISSRLDESLLEMRRHLGRLESAVPPERRGELDDLKERTRRVEELTRTLEVFAGSDPPGRREEVSALDLVEEVLRPSDNGIFRLPGHVAVDVRGQPGLWRIAVDIEALRRALGEILGNAVEAMPRGGKVTVRLSNLALEQAVGALSPGRFVEISISDAGHGMDRNQVLHVFDPFYSTKPRHRHRGVGLSVAYGVVRSHGGDILVDSRPERGTRVAIYLPAA